jgi:membrane protein implicated in regulation of membrane protease activity
VLALVAGVALLFLLPHPWNGVGFAAAMVWEIVGILFGVWWSQQDEPVVGANTLVGLRAVVVEACEPRGRVKIRGETW